jgi:hypothetical protein
MGSDKAKAEKKRLKAQAKIEKAKAEAEIAKAIAKTPAKAAPKKLWYKDPSWIRALAAIGGLLIALITLLLTFYL